MTFGFTPFILSIMPLIYKWRNVLKYASIPTIRSKCMPFKIYIYTTNILTAHLTVLSIMILNMKGEISLSNRQFVSYRMFLKYTKYYYALIYDGLMTALTHCHSTGIHRCPSYSRTRFFRYSFMSPATFYPCKSVTAYPINAFSSTFKSIYLNWKLQDHMDKWVL